MKKMMMALLMAIIATSAGAQSAEKLYEEGKRLYDEKNYVEAYPKLRAAAEKGHKKAQYRVGRCYDKGHAVEEDDKQAFEWYLKSANQGFPKAQYQVGKFYKDGKGGVEKDRKTAVAYFAKAARQDNADGQYALGKAYMKGKGIAADQKKAKSWLKKAVKNEKDGKAIRKDIEKDAANGKDDAKQLKEMMKK